MRETFGAKDPRSWLMRFHCQTAGVSLTAQQPENNIVRVAIQALAAVLGGAQSLHTNSMDEALALPSEKAVTIALRTQQIIAAESGAANTIDPLGGSYYLETLTNETEGAVYEYFRRIEALGGVLPAIEAGFMQQEIGDAAFTHQRQVERGEQIIVGVNQHVDATPPDIPILRMDPDGFRRQAARLEKLRRERDNEKVSAALNALREAARATQNLMPFLLDAARAYATLQEMTDVLRVEFGAYQEKHMF
jgi:methylmalonyl-CoA mutase N-terminal domain/subunit